MMQKDPVVAIILAAGRGSRMQELTSECPKCLLTLAGKPLLEWQLEALRQAGIKKIYVVRGYKAEMLHGNFECIENPNWETTNMVHSLICAIEAVPCEQAVISYADIVYKAEHVQLLLQSNRDIAITYDTAWLDLWSLRNEDPLVDAETFRQVDGKLTDIGGKPSQLNDIQGQYMGLLRFSRNGLNKVLKYMQTLAPERKAKLDMTSLLSGLVERGEHIEALPIRGGWCECDTAKDISIYEKHLTQEWLHDWRSKS